MVCAWKELVMLLPQWMQQDVDRLGKYKMQELRLRINSPPVLQCGDAILRLNRAVTRADLNHILNAASSYSPWAAASVSEGYLTAPGGHRLGLCGEAIIKNGVMTGIRELDSICLRVCRDIPGCGKAGDPGEASVLILGAPGWGKTTLLRDIARNLAEKKNVVVVDERRELFPAGYGRGMNMDVLLGCPKSEAMEIVLRTMGPQCIVVDEITSEKDCEALIHAAYCGVQILATAHASSRREFSKRPVYRQLLEHRIFQRLLILHPNQTFHTEEAEPCIAGRGQL